MRQLWVATAAIVVCLALDGVPALAQEVRMKVEGRVQATATRVASAPVVAERVIRSAWGCNLEVGSPMVTLGEKPRAVAVAGAACEERTRFAVIVVRVMRVRQGAGDEVIVADRVPHYFHQLEPFDLQWPEVWGAGVRAGTACRASWASSAPQLYARATFRKAGQSKRVILRTDPWSDEDSARCP
jgi:hypothetical protein